MILYKMRERGISRRQSLVNVKIKYSLSRGLAKYWEKKIRQRQLSLVANYRTSLQLGHQLSIVPEDCSDGPNSALGRPTRGNVPKIPIPIISRPVQLCNVELLSRSPLFAGIPPPIVPPSLFMFQCPPWLLHTCCVPSGPGVRQPVTCGPGPRSLRTILNNQLEENCLYNSFPILCTPGLNLTIPN